MRALISFLRPRPEDIAFRETVRGVKMIPLERAWLCQDCQVVGETAGYCWNCGSRAGMNLAGVLNRAEAQKGGSL